MLANETIKKCKIMFGTTKDCQEGGYILPDGSMLDFSGGKSKQRTIGHGQIRSCLPETTLTRSRDDAMTTFQKRGALRWHKSRFGHVDVELLTRHPPTAAQWNTIKRCTLQTPRASSIFFDIYTRKGGAVNYRASSGEAKTLRELRDEYQRYRQVKGREEPPQPRRSAPPWSLRF